MSPLNHTQSEQPGGSIPEVEYTVRMPEPWTHRFEVVITARSGGLGYVNLVMPVWTPGSYLVREFSRNVHSFSASDGEGKPLRWEKISKNTWQVHCGEAQSIKARYSVYAFEMSVRTSFLDDSHAYINGASLFMYLERHEKTPVRLRIESFPGWDTISTGLEPLDDASAEFGAPDYDSLIDCPLEIGSHSVFGFRVNDRPHYLAVYGKGNLDPARLSADLEKIVLSALDIFGDLPYRHFTFLILLTSDGRSGLEHSNSASLLINRWAFYPDDNYRRFLELAAHEFFHVWNVKRIRPIELGPFDYTKENFTRLLWVSEGFTDYYAGQILRRAGLISTGDYLASVAKAIQELQETPGRLVDSAADASFDAWIKFYRQDAHTPNITVSYYLKGGLIALILDLEIRKATGTGSLDEVMRLLYRKYHQESGRGFTDREFREACETVAGGPLDIVFNEYCYGTSEIDFDRYLGYAGLKMGESAGKDKGKPASHLGISLKTVDGKLLVIGVTSGSPAESQGLNVNDEVIALNGFRMNQELLVSRVEEAGPGAKLEFLISRDGRIREVTIIAGAKKRSEIAVERLPETSEGQRRVYESWLRDSWDPAPAAK